MHPGALLASPVLLGPDARLPREEWHADSTRDDDGECMRSRAMTPTPCAVSPVESLWNRWCLFPTDLPPDRHERACVAIYKKAKGNKDGLLGRKKRTTSRETLLVRQAPTASTRAADWCGALQPGNIVRAGGNQPSDHGSTCAVDRAAVLILWPMPAPRAPIVGPAGLASRHAPGSTARRPVGSVVGERRRTRSCQQIKGSRVQATVPCPWLISWGMLETMAWWVCAFGVFLFHSLPCSLPPTLEVLIGESNSSPSGTTQSPLLLCD